MISNFRQRDVDDIGDGFAGKAGKLRCHDATKIEREDFVGEGVRHSGRYPEYFKGLNPRRHNFLHVLLQLWR